MIYHEEGQTIVECIEIRNRMTIEMNERSEEMDNVKDNNSE